MCETHGDSMKKSSIGPRPPLTKKGERRVFLFITVFLFPALAILLVGGYGFFIWIMQMIFGPPGAH